MTPSDFIAAIAPPAQSSMVVTTIPASFTIAEAALESGWGSSGLAQQANNLFGVKADAAWHGAVWTMQTRECLNGQWVMVPARWRAYATWLGSITDHAEFLMSNPRYAAAFSAANGEDFATAIAAAGYATDPQYAQKIIATMRAHNLASFDVA